MLPVAPAVHNQSQPSWRGLTWQLPPLGAAQDQTRIAPQVVVHPVLAVSAHSFGQRWSVFGNSAPRACSGWRSTRGLTTPMRGMQLLVATNNPQSKEVGGHQWVHRQVGNGSFGTVHGIRLRILISVFSPSPQDALVQQADKPGERLAVRAGAKASASKSVQVLVTWTWQAPEKTWCLISRTTIF